MRSAKVMKNPPHYGSKKDTVCTEPPTTRSNAVNVNVTSGVGGKGQAASSFECIKKNKKKKAH